MSRALLLPTLCLAAIAGAAATSPAAVAMLSPDDLHAGQKAVVKTVFQGDSIESFDAEIIGVLRGGRAEGDMILARATSERVAKIGIAQGMSGSPVYVDGKLVGALSSGWSFTREPLFGVTPIGEMLRVLDQPTSADPGGTAGPTGLEASGLATPVRYREFHWDDTDTLPTPAPAAPVAASGVRPLALPLACGGLHPGALDAVTTWLAGTGFTVVPGGRAAGGGPTAASLEPGSAVAVDVMRGDLQLSAIGTVTWREGDRVLIFGHPFFQSGEVRLPMATAEIATIVPNEVSSFKLGVRGREAGVITQDRRTALEGHLGGAPRMLPIAVSVRAGGRTQRFRFESIEDRQMAPSLAGVATLNSLMESGGSGANQTLRWTLSLYRRGADPLVLRDVAAGDAPPGDLMTGVSTPLRFLLNNPFGRLTLDSVTVDVEVDPGREQWTLRNARVLDAAVRPGGRVRIECEVERWRGARETRRFELQAPEELPDGRYVLWVGGGVELAHYESTHLPGRFRPISLDDAWRRLANVHASDGLYAALFAKAPEVTTDGRDYPELPISALAVLAGGQSAGDRSRRGDTAELDTVRLALGGVTRGELLIPITVDSTAP